MATKKQYDLGLGWSALHTVEDGNRNESLVITGPAQKDSITLDTASVKTLRKIFKTTPGRLVRLGDVFPKYSERKEADHE